MIIRELGLQEYNRIWTEMKTFTVHRTPSTPNEIWILEHYPVYTQGQAGKPEHIIQLKSIPIVQSDRGGQVTYHGPGQLVAYSLIDIRRKNIGIRTFVSQMENVIMDVLAHFNVNSNTRCSAPGVYVQDKKIASIGLRVKNGCTYHGIALNVAMDLEPFSGINPCGFSSLKMTQMADLVPGISLSEVQKVFISVVLKYFDSHDLKQSLTVELE